DLIGRETDLDPERLERSDVLVGQVAHEDGITVGGRWLCDRRGFARWRWRGLLGLLRRRLLGERVAEEVARGLGLRLDWSGHGVSVRLHPLLAHEVVVAGAAAIAEVAAATLRAGRRVVVGTGERRGRGWLVHDREPSLQ